MSCSRPDLQEKLEEYVLHQLSDAEKREVEHHLLECEECLQNFHEQVPLVGAIEQEERDKVHPPEEPPPLPIPEAAPPGWAAASVAAMVLFLLALLVVLLDSRHLSRDPGRPRPETGASH